MANYHGSNEVISELREDGILILTINRPEKRNALNGATSAKILQARCKSAKRPLLRKEPDALPLPISVYGMLRRAGRVLRLSRLPSIYYTGNPVR